MVPPVDDWKLSIILIVLFCQSVLGMIDRTWWKYTTIYEVYLPSFKDSNGDGKGDIKGKLICVDNVGKSKTSFVMIFKMTMYAPGLTMKLDHFVESGIETIYITPFYLSPMEDGGYDIANFTTIDPTYGTMDDFNELIAEAKSRRMYNTCL